MGLIELRLLSKKSYEHDWQAHIPELDQIPAKKKHDYVAQARYRIENIKRKEVLRKTPMLDMPI